MAYRYAFKNNAYNRRVKPFEETLRGHEAAFHTARDAYTKDDNELKRLNSLLPRRAPTDVMEAYQKHAEPLKKRILGHTVNLTNAKLDLARSKRKYRDTTRLYALTPEDVKDDLALSNRYHDHFRSVAYQPLPYHSPVAPRRTVRLAPQASTISVMRQQKQQRRRYRHKVPDYDDVLDAVGPL
jgi:hypothetical protein